MPKFNSRRPVKHSAAQMFDLVADVERYPEFVPLCQSLKIRQRTPKPDGTEVVVAADALLASRRRGFREAAGGATGKNLNRESDQRI